MSQKAYKKFLAAMKALGDDEVCAPSIPVAIYLQEGEDLVHWCEEDRPLLEKAGLEWEVVEELPEKLAAVRYAQSTWNKIRCSKEEAQKRYERLVPEAHRLRDELLHHTRFAFRKRSDLLSQVRAATKGKVIEHLIQSLSDLAVLGETHSDLLEKVGVDLGLLDRAEEVSGELADLAAIVRGGRRATPQAKRLRDRAYTLLKKDIDEIRETGRYVFWRNPERAKGYASEHLRRH